MNRAFFLRNCVVCIALMVTLLVSCVQKSVESPTPDVTGDKTENRNFGNHLLISEVLAGGKGNNNRDFIELYNPTDQPINLKGYSLLYQLSADHEAATIHDWKETAFVPPNGYYLLGYAGQDFEIEPDMAFEEPLIPSKGGVRLADPNRAVVDQVAWGEGPKGYAEGRPAPSLKEDVSLERLPGGELGSQQDSDSNSDDFVFNPEPIPQNSGSSPSPTFEPQLRFEAQTPNHLNPG